MLESPVVFRLGQLVCISDTLFFWPIFFSPPCVRPSMNVGTEEHETAPPYVTIVCMFWTNDFGRLRVGFVNDLWLSCKSVLCSLSKAHFVIVPSSFVIC
jgi:hypothetical protein